MHRAIVSLSCLLFVIIGCTKSFESTSSVRAEHSKNGNAACPVIKGPVSLRESHEAIVTKIADGDTFTACLLPEMSGSVRVRVLGIDCPESHENAKCKRDGKQGGRSCADQIPLGLEATSLAQELIFNQTVHLESPHGDGEFKRDNFGRLLAYVRTSQGDDFGRIMIRDGHCENYQWKYPHPRGQEYGGTHVQKRSRQNKNKLLGKQGTNAY